VTSRFDLNGTYLNIGFSNISASHQEYQKGLTDAGLIEAL
jgi:hypothetical protein